MSQQLVETWSGACVHLTSKAIAPPRARLSWLAQRAPNTAWNWLRLRSGGPRACRFPSRFGSSPRIHLNA